MSTLDEQIRTVEQRVVATNTEMKSAALDLSGHHAIPALVALRIVISHCIRHMHDPADALRARLFVRRPLCHVDENVAVVVGGQETKPAKSDSRS